MDSEIFTGAFIALFLLAVAAVAAHWLFGSTSYDVLDAVLGEALRSIK